MAYEIAEGRADDPTGLVELQFTREALDALVETWNDNNVRSSDGLIIRLSYHEYAPGRVALTELVFTEDYLKELANG